MQTSSLSAACVVAVDTADVGAHRERVRQRRLAKSAVVGAAIATWMWLRVLSGRAPWPAMPHFGGRFGQSAPLLLLVVILGAALLLPLVLAGRSPHVLFRSSEIETSLDDVRGAPSVVEEVVNTLNLFLAHKTFKREMGGTPRRAVLFEGPPGTGKTHVAKAMAKEAGVPFLFVSSSAFQSMYYGQTNRRIRAFFGALRSLARKEGGAVGFIEEIDAVAAARSGIGGIRGEGISGVVNELLVQLQSFDTPPWSFRTTNALIERINRVLPAHAALRKRTAPPANILLIGATNRVADLDAALLRPGRFDRTIHFDVPNRGGRREIIDYYLAKKAHEPDLDDPGCRDDLAGATAGYTPVMIEHLFDEALVWALRRGASKLSDADVQHAKLTEELGLAQPVTYTEAERRTIATHEAGHAVVAWLTGTTRHLDVLSIIKRREALGMLAHSDAEERFLKSETEMRALIEIALGGLVAEELFFGEISSGPASDLKLATTFASMMVGSFGMQGSLFSYDAVEVANANLVAKIAADDTARHRVEALLDESRTAVRELLEQNRHVVEGVRDTLLEREELVGEEIVAALALAAAAVR